VLSATPFLYKTERTNYAEPLTNKVGENGETKLKEENEQALSCSKNKKLYNKQYEKQTMVAMLTFAMRKL